MTIIYRSAFKLPSIRTGDEHVVLPIAAQALTLDIGFLCRNRMQAGDERSPQSLQTSTTSEYYTQDQDSSEKNDIAPLLCLNLCFCTTQSRHLLLCCIVMVPLLTAYTAANVVALYERTLGVLQTYPFPTSDG
ncbi:hypothetical protein TNCV_169871 [Trichonephila clavipes]|nr:hypothetical protein TNCV_169871 [Trichonephila clavipes]